MDEKEDAQANRTKKQKVAKANCTQRTQYIKQEQEDKL
jgi:hypothetical protein